MTYFHGLAYAMQIADVFLLLTLTSLGENRGMRFKLHTLNLLGYYFLQNPICRCYEEDQNNRE